MSFSEIMALRKAGKTDEAREMASKALGKNPNDVWSVRAMSWIIYDDISAAANSLETFDKFQRALKQLDALEWQANDHMVFDQTAFKIIKVVNMLFEHKRFKDVSELFNSFQHFPFSKPSQAFSSLVNVFQKGAEEWDEYLDFMDWAGWTHFRPDDFQPSNYNGARMQPIVEKVTNTYAKTLLKGISPASTDQPVEFDTKLITSFLPQLKKLHAAYPRYMHTPLYIAKLLLLSGENNEALQAYLPFARQKKKEFWAWTFIADTCPGEPDLQFSCYCKALSLKAPEKYLVKTRMKMVAMCVARHLYPEVRTEIERVIATRKAEGWALGNAVLSVTSQDWYDRTEPFQDNRKLYQTHLRKAEELLYQDVKPIIVVVSHVNASKKMLNFLTEEKTEGFFKYAGFIQSPRIGDVLQVRLHMKDNNGFAQCLTSKIASPETNCQLVRQFEGSLSVHPKGFGFADKVYIPEPLIRKGNLNEGMIVIGRAMRRFDKKKKKWGWSAFAASPLQKSAGDP